MFNILKVYCNLTFSRGGVAAAKAAVIYDFKELNFKFNNKTCKFI